jgi:hypothetical protein
MRFISFIAFFVGKEDFGVPPRFARGPVLAGRRARPEPLRPRLRLVRLRPVTRAAIARGTLTHVGYRKIPALTAYDHNCSIVAACLFNHAENPLTGPHQKQPLGSMFLRRALAGRARAPVGKACDRPAPETAPLKRADFVRLQLPLFSLQ